MAHNSESLRQAFHYFYPDELPALKELARSLPANPIVVNIGAGAGTSGLAFMESRPDLYLYTVDIQKDNSPFGCLYAERVVLEQAGLWGVRNEQRHCSSIYLGELWQKGRDYMPVDFAITSPKDKGKADMVFIDGDHSEEGCRGDILAWLPNIKPGGIIAIHDYLKSSLWTEDYNLLKPSPDLPHPKDWPGVDKAVDDLLFRGGYELIAYVESLVAFRIPL